MEIIKARLTDSVHSGAHSGTMFINFCHTAAVSGTMKLVFHIFSRSKFSTEHQFHCAADTGGMAYVYRPSAAVGGGMDGIRETYQTNWSYDNNNEEKKL